MSSRRDQLRDLYGFDFPDDLFRFWQFANRLRPLDPLGALWDALDIRLVGPFDVLAGRFDGRTPQLSPLLHWRYYLDPPEFFTVLAGGADKLHWGYYLDDPGRGPAYVASYYGDDVFELSVDGPDLFAAVRLHLESAFAAEGADRIADLERLRSNLTRWGTGDRPETGYDYVDRYEIPPARRAGAIASTPEGMGVVAPPGTYRPLSLPDKKLRSMLRKEGDRVAAVEEGRQAIRDGFPATALKLGKELWPLRGGRKSEYAYELLDAGYAGLGRDVLRRVLTVHRANRGLRTVDILAAEGETGEEE